MSQIRRYFPEGIATGSAFINRDEERAYLIGRIQSGQHTVLMAPRRYGKTSLVNKVAEELKMPFASIDLLAAYNAEYVRDQIVNKVGRLVFELLPGAKKAKEKLLQIFQQMKPEISIGAFGQRLVLNLSNPALQDMTDVLLRCDEAAQQFNRKAVIFFDEFQQISQLKDYHSIEASIRHAVERSKNIAYVFSGSNRRLLKQMFGDKGRPLYRLCQILAIERIEPGVYELHLQKLAKKKWQQRLDQKVIDEIFYRTEMHPFYINALCQNLWAYDKAPSVRQVQGTWRAYVKAQRYLITQEVSELSANQRKILVALSEQAAKEVQSAHFTAPLNISPSSAQQATETLRRNDMIYKNEAGLWCVLDPAVKYYLNVLV